MARTYNFRPKTLELRAAVDARQAIKHALPESPLKKKKKKKKARKSRSFLNLTRMMGAGEKALSNEEMYCLETTLNSPLKLKTRFSDLRDVEEIVLTSPLKGASTSKLTSPGGRFYQNQGKIKIIKTDSEGKQQTSYTSLFFPLTKASQTNRVTFPSTPPEGVAVLREHFENLKENATFELPAVLPVTLKSIHQIHKQGKKRYPDNKAVMEYSARQAADLGELSIPKNIRLHWLHVKAAYLAGIYDNKIKRSRSQVPSNLILGTCEGNAHMTLIEMAFKQILEKEALGIHQINQCEVIKWLKGYEGVIAEKIRYILEIPGRRITYDLDPWTLNKVPDNKQDLVNKLVEKIFSEPQSPLKTPSPKKLLAQSTNDWSSEKPKSAIALDFSTPSSSQLVRKLAF